MQKKKISQNVRLLISQGGTFLIAVAGTFLFAIDTKPAGTVLHKKYASTAPHS